MPTAVVSAVSGSIATGVSGSGSTATAPVARTNTVSPSRGVCAGRIARASPSCAATATRRQPAGLSAASVATTAMVVFSGLVSRCRAAYAATCSAVGARSPNSAASSVIHGNPVAGSSTSPAEFTTTIAPTVTPEASTLEAVPTPPLSTPARAPTPAPTQPTATSGPAPAAAE